MKYALLSLILLTATMAGAAEIRLYSAPGVFASPLSKVPFEIVPGDTLIFSDGHRFTVRRLLGGRNNMLLDVGDQKVLRIPISPMPRRLALLTGYVSGHKSLVQNGVRVPLLYESDPREYVLQSYVEVRSLLSTIGTLQAEERERAYAQLVLFASTTTAFHSIGDFSADQLAWDGERWTLLDWTDEHILNANGGIFADQAQVFRGVTEYIPKPVYQQILEVISASREMFPCESNLSGSFKWDSLN